MNSYSEMKIEID